jgi:hypothetical protein
MPDPTPDICAFFFHHRADPVTVRNLALLRASNPAAAVVVAHRADGGTCQPLAGSTAVTCPTRVTGNWANLDQVWLAWYRSSARVDAARYLFLEADCAVTGPLADTYPAADAVASEFIGPPGASVGIAQPFNGVMLARSVMDRLAAMRYPPHGRHCEWTLGTAVRVAGFAWTQLLPAAAARNVPSQQGTPAVTGPGVWHPVRAVLP